MDRTTAFGGNRIPELDGLRGLAILGVVCAHYFGEVPHGLRFLTFGWLGVDLFFVLSGFLIGGILIANRESPGYFATFYIRRACRIFPAYYAVVALTLTLSAVLKLKSAPWFDPLFPPATYLTYTQNFAIALTGRAQGDWLLPTWTLAVEEQFYLLLPVIVFLTPPRRLLPVTVAVIASGPAFRLWALATSRDLSALVLLPARWDLLFFGVLAAEIRHRAEFWRGLVDGAALRLCSLVGALGSLALVIADKRWGTHLLITFGPTFLGILFASYILLVVSGAPEGRRFRGAFLRFFGVISYGLYLIHQPIAGLTHGLMLGRRPDVGSVLELLVTGAALAASIAIARASWLWFESPLIRLGHRRQYGQRPIPAPVSSQPATIAATSVPSH